MLPPFQQNSNCHLAHYQWMHLTIFQPVDNFCKINSCNTLVETEDNNQTQRINCFISFELHLHYEMNTLLLSKVLKSYLYVSTNFLGSILLSIQTMNLKEISRSCFQVLDYSKGISKTDYPKSTNFKLRMVFSLKSSNRMRSNS